MNCTCLNCEGFTVTNINSLPLIRDDRFTALGIPHGYTTRHGGVSSGEFESLNLAYSETRNDPNENVEKNYDILLNAFGVPRSRAVRTHQTHTDVTVAVDSSNAGTGSDRPGFTDGTDGLITNTAGVLLTVRMADCLPILIYDPVSRAVGAVHSGWKGTIGLIAPKAINEMCRLYGSKKENLLISFGPSVGSCCYRVGEEFRSNFISRHSITDSAFEKRGDGIYADMRRINRLLLESCGIPSENISVYSRCTCCNPEHFFSFRRQKEQRGTMSAAIMLPDNR